MAHPTHTERLHAMDALRAIAMLLGIALHAMLAYKTFVWPQWPVDDDASSPIFEAGFWIIHLFRMEVFFFMAGFFACLMLARYGLIGFVKNRAGRIAGPLVVCMITIIPILAFIWAWGLNLRLPEESRTDFGTTIFDFFKHRKVDQYFVPIHLWFLEHLLVMCAIAGVLHVAATRFPPVTLVSEKIIDAWAWIVRHALAAPVFAILILPLLFLQGTYADDGTWQRNPGVGTQQGAVPPPEIVLYYAVFFTGGWLLYRRRHDLVGLAKLWHVQLALGFLLSFVYLEQLKSIANGEDRWNELYLAAATATAFLVVGFSGVFIRYFQRPSRVMRYVSDSAYWMYIIHLPLVILLNIAFLPLQAPAIAKFLLVCAIACVIMLGSYHLFVRYTFIGVFLNGPRVRNERHARRAVDSKAVE